VGDHASPRGKRPAPIWLWAASLVLVAAGAVGGIYATHHGPAVGPSLSKPFGRTSLDPTPTTTTLESVMTTTAPVRPMTTTVNLVTVATTRRAHVSSTTSGSTASAWTPKSSRSTASRWAKRSRPIHLTIPKLGISVQVSELGLNKDRSVSVPRSFAVPGWYKFGPSPGQEGSAVILGHVDSYHGPAVFYRLATLRLGNRVIVKEADRKTLTFSVIGLREYSKAHFPARVVYGPRKYAALQLVTCGGVFDRRTGHYLSNIVVFTALVKR
jgi:sortase (surface protein transpeptidase)